jgi:hypothetical protein
MEKSNLNFYLIVTAGRFVNIYDYMKMSIFLYLNYHPINIILIINYTEKNIPTAFN